MLEGIIKAFEDRVSEVGWIDSQTVKAVKEKVSETKLWDASIIDKRDRKRDRPTDRQTDRL